ncbi:helix-turn-helix domain-containing protein [Streptomyces sp. NPDC088733]|uniref:helix-turn-helix domain-containing protein n=1 Tax=Streptomyces sp. NPDC088733 TaxID=3365880 RepID=UPI00382D59F6
MTGNTTSHARGDIGRRVARRREELGLSRDEVALRAGLSTGYLRFLEEEATAAPAMGTLRGLAAALSTTVVALNGGEADLPPGRGQASAHPRFLELEPDECRELLGTHGVGRVVTLADDGVAVLPVNYSIVGQAIAFRTATGSAPAAVAGTDVTFEVDSIDEALSQGWSVLARGHARAVAGKQAAEMERLAYTGPWPGRDDRDLWIRIDVNDLTGRRIEVP